MGKRQRLPETEQREAGSFARTLTTEKQNMPKTAPSAWAAARAAYSAGVLTAREIVENYGMGKSTLYKRIKQEGWMSPQSGPLKKTGEAGQPQRMDQGTYVERLHHLLDKTLIELELSLMSVGVKTTPERERDVRTLASVVRVIEKLEAIEPKTDPQNEAEQTQEDEDRMRAEIADRLARLRRLRDRGEAGGESRADAD